MLPAEIVRQVKRLQFHMGRHVAGVLFGEYLSVFKGQGMEFSEVRPYVPGDDVRAIDWNVTARTGSPYIKRFVEERELTVLLLVDISASQEFGSGQRSKREAAAELAALIALSASHNHDKVGLLLFHGEADVYIPPRKGQRHALRVVREVLAGGEVEHDREPHRGLVSRLLAALRLRRRQDRRRLTSISAALSFCQKVLPRRAVIFLVSDFLDEGYLPVLRGVRRKHDVVAALLTDERERQMPAVGLVALEDAESGEQRIYDTSSPQLGEALTRAADDRQRALQAALGSAGVDLLHIEATRPVVDPLLRYFRKKSKRGRR